MRHAHRLLVCLPLLGTAACAADRVAGPQAVPAPEGTLEDLWARPPGAPDILIRVSKSPVSVTPHHEPLYIVEGVVQEGPPDVLIRVPRSRIPVTPHREPLYIVEGVVQGGGPST